MTNETDDATPKKEYVHSLNTNRGSELYLNSPARSMRCGTHGMEYKVIENTLDAEILEMLSGANIIIFIFLRIRLFELTNDNYIIS